MCCPRDPLAVQKRADGARKSNEKRGAQLVKTWSVCSHYPASKRRCNKFHLKESLVKENVHSRHLSRNKAIRQVTEKSFVVFKENGRSFV